MQGESNETQQVPDCLIAPIVVMDWVEMCAAACEQDSCGEPCEMILKTAVNLALAQYPVSAVKANLVSPYSTQYGCSDFASAADTWTRMTAIAAGCPQPAARRAYDSSRNVLVALLAVARAEPELDEWADLLPGVLSHFPRDAGSGPPGDATRDELMGLVDYWIDVLESSCSQRACSERCALVHGAALTLLPSSSSPSSCAVSMLNDEPSFIWVLAQWTRLAQVLLNCGQPHCRAAAVHVIGTLDTFAVYADMQFPGRSSAKAARSAAEEGHRLFAIAVGGRQMAQNN